MWDGSSDSPRPGALPTTAERTGPTSTLHTDTTASDLCVDRETVETNLWSDGEKGRKGSSSGARAGVLAADEIKPRQKVIHLSSKVCFHKLMSISFYTH